jgi:putative ABC transport system permease protein
MYFQADLSISMMDAYRPDRVEEEMKAIPGVISVEGWGSGTAVVKLANDQDGPTISINAPPENTTLVEPKMKMGRWLLPGESNVIVLGERFLYSFPELQVGDKIKLDVNKTGKNSEWTIVGFFSMGGKSGGFLAYIPLSSWMTVSGTATRLSRYEVCMDESVDLTNIAGLTDTIESQLSSKGFNVRLIQKNDTFIRDSSSGLNILSAFLFIIAILVAFVGSIGMTGTMSLNVMERTREIGILRSIGASDKAVMENVLTEGVMIGILSWLGGIILSFPIQKFMSDAMGFAVFGSTMETAFAWIGYVLWLFLSIIIAVLASIMPAKNAIRLTIREVLSIE